MIMSPSTCSQALAEWISLHAVIFMLSRVESTSDINRGPEPYQSEEEIHFELRNCIYTIEAGFLAHILIENQKL